MQPDPSAHEQFWQWFEQSGDRLREAIYGPDPDARDAAYSELEGAVGEVQPGVMLEIGSAPDDGPRQLVVSADGHPEHVDAVKDFVASAPELAGWEVVAFRPRMKLGDAIEIQIADERVGVDDVWFQGAEELDGIGLTLYVRGLTEGNEKPRSLGASLLVEHTVGERDILTLLASQAVEPLPNDLDGLRPLPELAGVFDAIKTRKYPPPRLIQLDPEGDWSILKGSIDESPAFILLNAALRPLAGHPIFDRRLTVSLPFESVDDEGMPADKEEFAAVSELGDDICESLTEGQESLHALTITTQGRRDLIFYTSDPIAAAQRLNALRAEGLGRPMEVDLEWDTFWMHYRACYQVYEEGEDEG